MSANLNAGPPDGRLSPWGMLNPGRYTLLFVLTLGVAAILWGTIAWQSRLPIWGATLIAVGVLALPLTAKWQDDLRRFGLAATVLGVLLLLQAFHTVEHITQVIQYYVLDRPAALSFGLISSLNAEWVHFTWNWIVVALVVFLYVKGLRNVWATLLVAWAVLHSLEHTYMLVRYYLVLQELAKLGVAPLPVVQALPGILGRDGWLALSELCGRIPVLTTMPRVAVHFWWNFGEITLLALAAWWGMPGLVARHGDSRRGAKAQRNAEVG
jgi:hypothetical protein